MKIFGLSLLILMVAACVKKEPSVFSQPLAEGQLSLIVNVSNIRCCDGVLRMAVYANESNWMSDTDMARGRLGFIESDTQSTEIHGLAAGRYAVAVFQDKDSDKKLDRWLWLVPSEPYGFSNNVGQYGPVSFDKASFELSADKIINIELNSW